MKTTYVNTQRIRDARKKARKQRAIDDAAITYTPASMADPIAVIPSTNPLGGSESFTGGGGDFSGGGASGGWDGGSSGDGGGCDGGGD